MNMNKILSAAVVLGLAGLGAVAFAGDFVMEYDAPAGTWNEALPLGNGRLGAMVFGGAGTERFQLNEDTLWDGRSAMPRISRPAPREGAYRPTTA